MIIINNKNKEQISIEAIGVHYDEKNFNSCFVVHSNEEMLLFLGYDKTEKLIAHLQGALSYLNDTHHLATYNAFINDNIVLSSFSKDYLFFQVSKRLSDISKKKADIRFSIKCSDIDTTYNDKLFSVYYDLKDNEDENENLLVIYNKHLTVYNNKGEIIFYQDFGDRMLLVRENYKDDESSQHLSYPR